MADKVGKLKKILNVPRRPLIGPWLEGYWANFRNNLDEPAKTEEVEEDQEFEEGEEQNKEED